MENEDRSVHLTGPVTNSPISSGEFHGPVNYDYSGSTTININISSSESQSVLRQVKKTPDKEFQIQGSSNKGSENISNRQDLNSMEAVIKEISNVLRSKEEETGRRIGQIKTNNDLQFSRNELLVKEALIEGGNYAAMGRYYEAISSYDRILTLDPNHVVALSNKGLVLVYIGQLSQGLSYLDRALSIDPNNDIALSNKGLVLAQLGQPFEALSYFDRALSINPNNDMALNNKAAVLNFMGRIPEALLFG
jgi:tetratricopeptide (TPR) repeat protein